MLRAPACSVIKAELECGQGAFGDTLWAATTPPHQPAPSHGTHTACHRPQGLNTDLWAPWLFGRAATYHSGVYPTSMALW